MNEKQIAKRYLISVPALYLAGAVLLGAFAFALSSRAEAMTLSGGQIAAIAFLAPLLPVASYSGFVTAFLRVGELSKKQMIAIVVLFPIFLAGITVLGAVMTVPNIVKYIRVLIKK